MKLRHAYRTELPLLILTGCTLLGFVPRGETQTFAFKDSDLCLTFRKVTPYTENNEAVVNIGQASRFVAAPVGTTLTVTGFSPAQLVPGAFTTMDNLSWAVIGWCLGATTNYPGYPSYTVWLTIPRFDNSVRSPDAMRQGSGSQSLVKSKMFSITTAALSVSKSIGISNIYNTPTFLRESIATYGGYTLGVWMGSLVDNTIGSLNDTWPDNIENATPEPFTDVSRSDLYEVRPLDNGHGGQIDDPHTGNTGLAWYVGYFELKSNGTMTFKRENASTSTNPPPPPLLSIARIGNLNRISFVSSNTATYKLFFTNSAGLGTAPSGWPSAPGFITGDGTTQSFQDSTTDPERVYRVEGH